ncbi:acyl-CoA ligase (AMP-forming), exosortase A system-associated [Tsuneonella suprasediminis]|uniref:Acyl-CoA ligase (AMP-forming), exosortase A system-associated n=1 Tax=Tsuneonella suprasediminis TaxID=2306996 RepID=A0A419R0J0_9SPHN|nr:acyl-CoA ligase (AMP-forming), exosortase A system-associated [Tsuneonella suprasediminis]RJX67008.1 acyl-CoA ligase (AMP-forming), exosortase A system-associated [Tsuneonella suprasediminis]
MFSAPDSHPWPLDHLAERGEPDAAALVLRDRVITHQDLRTRVGQLATWLLEHAAKGDRVASWAAKGEATCLLPLACARAGIVHVPINPLLKRMQVAHILSDSGAVLLIANNGRLRSLADGDVPDNCTVVAEEDLFTQVELCARLGPSDHNPDELAAILYTSGSTGRPKGVMLSHANMWLGAVSVATYLGVESDDVVLAVQPLSFDYGQNQLLSTWYAGGSVVPLDYLLPRDVTKACARHRVTTLACVPPLWIQLTEIDWPQEAVASMRRLTNTGGALTVGLVHDLRRIFPDARLFPMYGLTEAFRSTYLDPSLVDSHPTSIGKAIPFAEILVVNDEGAIAAAGEEGELVHCGPLVAHGYWQDPERTDDRFRPAPKDSMCGGMAVWSGDRVKRDEDGLLYFVGRRDSMIKSSGNRISPQEVEDAAIATGLVAEAVAVGKPDPKLGHVVCLAVRPAAGFSEDVLRNALSQSLPNFMQPRHFRVYDAMPRNPNGKLDRNAIALEFAQ